MAILYLKKMRLIKLNWLQLGYTTCIAVLDGTQLYLIQNVWASWSWFSTQPGRRKECGSELSLKNFHFRIPLHNFTKSCILERSLGVGIEECIYAPAPTSWWYVYASMKHLYNGSLMQQLKGFQLIFFCFNMFLSH